MTWTSAIKIRGEDGQNGKDGQDGYGRKRCDVNERNVFNVFDKWQVQNLAFLVIHHHFRTF